MNPSKLTEYAFAIEQEKKAIEALNFLRYLLGAYDFDKNTTVAQIQGYLKAMRQIINQAEQ